MAIKGTREVEVDDFTFAWGVAVVSAFVVGVLLGQEPAVRRYFHKWRLRWQAFTGAKH